MSLQECSEKETFGELGTKQLVHNSAPAHRLLVVKKRLAKYSVTASEHVSHFLDLSTPDFSISAATMSSERTMICKRQ
jgi:hypothetical protein